MSFIPTFSYRINGLNVEMNVVPFIMGQSYQTIKYKGRYNIALVRFTLTMDSHFAVINVPFYQSNIVGTWFPFHCCSQRYQSSPVEYYYRSEYGDSYLFKMGHYFPEPFAIKSDDIPRDAGIRNIIPNTQNSCNRQRNFLLEQIKDIPPELLYSEQGTGVHTILSRFGNLLYLTASYFLFGNNDEWNPTRYIDGSPEKAFVYILHRIGNQAKFADKKWNEIVSTLPRISFNPLGYYAVDDSKLLNYILAVNNVPMPHYQEISRLDNGLDAKFITCMKLLQAVSELYLDPNTKELENRFKTILIRAIPILNISLSAHDNLQIGNDYHVWLVPEGFSGNNSLVRLYRFL